MLKIDALEDDPLFPFWGVNVGIFSRALALAISLGSVSHNMFGVIFYEQTGPLAPGRLLA